MSPTRLPTLHWAIPLCSDSSVTCSSSRASLGDIAHREGPRRVRYVALHGHPHVDPQDVAFLQPSAVRDAVDHHVVGRCADGPREPPVAFERGHAALRAYESLRQPIQLFRGHARSYLLGQEIQASLNHLARPGHLLQLRLRLSDDHCVVVPRGPRRARSSLGRAQSHADVLIDFVGILRSVDAGDETGPIVVVDQRLGLIADRLPAGCAPFLPNRRRADRALPRTCRTRPRASAG